MPQGRGGDPIRFGTNGWRGILAEDFTFPRLRRAVRGVARLFAEAGGGEVVVAHDTRFLGPEMAQLSARVLAEAGLVPVLGRGSVPTPAVTRAVRRRRAVGAVVLTASHNPPEYHGLKVFGASGGCIDDAAARRIEAWIEGARDDEPRPARTARTIDLRGPYVREVLRRLDREVLARSRLRVAYDAMHGAAAGVLDAVLERAGLRVERLREGPDPRFGGASPDPIRAHLTELARRVRALRGRRLGLATDGDGDRFAVMDEGGRLLSSSDALALLVEHLAASGRVKRGLAISLATGSLVERVAQAHGLPVQRLPIGFKHLSRALADGSADLAGEESGGFALGAFGNDKDGILAACLLTEIAAPGAPALRARVAALRRRHRAGECGQLAVPAAGLARQALGALRRAPPERVGGTRVRTAQSGDGLHLGLDDGFLMLRLSGTEPLLRVYAEAPGAAALRRRLAAGEALLRRAGSSPGSR